MAGVLRGGGTQGQGHRERPADSWGRGVRQLRAMDLQGPRSIPAGQEEVRRDSRGSHPHREEAGERTGHTPSRRAQALGAHVLSEGKTELL